MLAQIWNTALVHPLANALVYLYTLLWGNLGLAIIALTVLIKVITLPLSLPSIKAAKKQKELMPELKQLKEQYKDDKKKQMEVQAKFFQERGLNPSSGCLLQLLSLVVIFALYQVFITAVGENGGTTLNSILYPFLQFKGDAVLNPSFLYLNLGKPDPYFILPVLAAVTQFILSKIMMPQVSKEEKLAKKTPEKSDDLMYNMQEQSMYLMPVMTLLIGWKLASGLVLYWLLSSALQLVQQVTMDGHVAQWSKKLFRYGR